MVAVVYVGAILLPLLLVLGSIARFAARRLDPDGEPLADGPPATVTELRAPVPPPDPLPSLPVGFRYDAVAPGPLQIVDGDGPTTKVCPDCAETVLHSARVCKHCHFRFDPPLSGSHAV